MGLYRLKTPLFVAHFSFVDDMSYKGLHELRKNQIYEIIGERKFHISPKPIRDKETYEDYMAHVEEQDTDADRTSGNRWTEAELEALADAIENGVTQLEMAAALPHRSWQRH